MWQLLNKVLSKPIKATGTYTNTVVTGGPKSLKNLKMNNVVDIIRDTHLAPIIVYVILRVGGVVGKLLLCRMTYILSLLTSLHVYGAVCVCVCVW